MVHSMSISTLTLCRLGELENAFRSQLEFEESWPVELPDPVNLYSDFLNEISSATDLGVCACCGCIGRHGGNFEIVSLYSPLLSSLSVDPLHVGFPFACGIPHLDARNVMIDPKGILLLDNGQLSLAICQLCHTALKSSQNYIPPSRALANHRWVGSVPEELQGLTWLEELFISRSHQVQKIVRLGRRDATAYFAIKGHAILLPQNTTRFLHLLPPPPSILPDIVRVVWLGSPRPRGRDLESHFQIRTDRVLRALTWLCCNHDDYKGTDGVEIDYDELERWGTVRIASELIDSITVASNTSVGPDIASRSGFATEDTDTEYHQGDLPFDTSAILDVNNVSLSDTAITLHSLRQFALEAASRQDEEQGRLESGTLDPSARVTANVVNGSTIRNDWNDPTYFTSSYPVLFPWGTGGHLHPNRTTKLSYAEWLELLLKNSSRFDPFPPFYFKFLAPS
jgi:hypothetical protein